MSVIEFWDEAVFDADLGALCATAVPVKGTSFHNPLRLMEIYGNVGLESALTWPEANAFLPRIPGVDLNIGNGVQHPPFTWEECDPQEIAVNFTYTTNAVYRILENLSEIGHFSENQINGLLDRVCLQLTSIYKSNRHSLIKGINNNINMYLVSKAVESIVGVNVYNCERQEIERTTQALHRAIEMAKDHLSLTPKQQMAIALGKGIAFMERHAGAGPLGKNAILEIGEICYRYNESNIAIDHRDQLIDLVAAANDSGRRVTMCAILDDTAETVDDLLWMQQLLELYPLLQINLLVNRVQISINFSSHMLRSVFGAISFRSLADRVGKQLVVTETYCPLISLQYNLLDSDAERAIREADLVFVKGLNFFETCQLAEKDTFYSFVVYGPVSRSYTGLSDLSGVFAFLPKGKTGYRRTRNACQRQTLADVCGKTQAKA
ncbi:MAG: hypothetical protein KZQ87_12650 [Candidatus Thiodiazotropha sp. (ex Cardiolucina cf. quadrata)]|nr:hypothetical protein [Candidatus Thiodiazotropha sp. (ex Cardiolucina cf. quadrata)]